MRFSEAEALIEALLFISGEALSLEELSDAIKLDRATTKAIIVSLRDKLLEEKRGIELAKIDEKWQLRTSPRLFSYIRDAFKDRRSQGMSQTLLETLAIIAYKQPITKAGIEKIRGVSADHAVNKLLEKGIIKELGKEQSPGRPMLFGTTLEFLRCFGFKSIEDLPGIETSDKP